MNSKPPLIIGIGELLWDCFESHKRPGGAPSNVTYHVNQLGLESLLVSSIGTDALGEELLASVQAHGLITKCVHQDPKHQTGTVTVDTTDPDHPSYTIHEDVAWDYILIKKEWLTKIATASALCFGTLAQRNETSRNSIHQAILAASKAMIVYDVNLRPPWLHIDWITQSLLLAHVVKLNVDEVKTLCQLLNRKFINYHSFAVFLRKEFNVTYVFITKAEDGCYAADATTEVEIPGKSIEVADAVGAGDAFTAALIYGLLKNARLEDITAFANDIGALVASKIGAMPDISSDFESLKQLHDIE